MPTRHYFHSLPYPCAKLPAPRSSQGLSPVGQPSLAAIDFFLLVLLFVAKLSKFCLEGSIDAKTDYE